MGMFDYLKINTNKLPVSEKEKKIIGTDPGWQTKDFDCILTTIEITDDNLLKIKRFNLVVDRSKKNALGTFGVFTHEDERIETINHHGYVNFYTGVSGCWYEFNAKFTDGKLIEITGGKEENH